jgi:diguanylate cyclase (GGDEF)-like protein
VPEPEARDNKRRRPGRLAVRLGLPLALAGAAVGAGTGVATTLSARNSAEQALEAQAVTVARLVDAAIDRRGRGAAGQREVRAIARTTGARVRLARSDRMPAPAGGAGVREYRFQLHSARGQVVVVGLSDAPVRSATRHAIERAGGAAIVALALLILIAVRLLRTQVARPLRKLTERIAHLSDFGATGGPDVTGAREFARAGDGVDALARTVSQLASQASTDPLTGAANRRAFDSALGLELARAKRNEGSVALVVFDFDGFKEINDRHGHAVGDDLLRQTAEKLQAQMRLTDVLARVGGDEFALVLPDMRPERAKEVVERARAAATVTLEGEELTWCAGVACYPAHAEDPRTLYECADGALYVAKASGSGCTRLYDPQIVATSRTQGERAEIAALFDRPDAITPVFQPIVSLSTGRVSGYEALTRFPSPPDRRPDEWFALAQRVGLGPKLEARAVAAALAIPDRPEGTYLSFNLSPSALASPDVVAILPQDLTGLVVEITEHERVADEDELRSHLAPLRERGARIAVDDAGAGYAGLQQVMRIQPDIIKLDRSLVADVDSDPAKAALIDAFVRFAHGTGAVVCAEGIETAGELRAVADLDVTYGQGFGLARPSAPWESMSPWVSATLSRRGLRSHGDSAGEDGGDHRLAQLAARLAQVASPADLPDAESAIAVELGADDVCLLRCVDDGQSFEAVSQRRWLGFGTRLRASNYATMRNVLATGDAVHVLGGDAGADGGELALLRRADASTMLLAPVIAGGRELGVLLLFRGSDRRWTRAEVSRARVVGFALAPLIETQAAPALSVVPDAGGLPLP